MMTVLKTIIIIIIINKRTTWSRD